jgi:hypothetical protein
MRGKLLLTNTPTNMFTPQNQAHFSSSYFSLCLHAGRISLTIKLIFLPTTGLENHSYANIIIQPSVN